MSQIYHETIDLAFQWLEEHGVDHTDATQTCRLAHAICMFNDRVGLHSNDAVKRIMDIFIKPDTNIFSPFSFQSIYDFNLQTLKSHHDLILAISLFYMIHVDESTRISDTYTDVSIHTDSMLDFIQETLLAIDMYHIDICQTLRSIRIHSKYTTSR